VSFAASLSEAFDARIGKRPEMMTITFEGMWRSASGEGLKDAPRQLVFYARVMLGLPVGLAESSVRCSHQEGAV
jgi:hypothetical protein